jgi:4-amino-4-deoxy-L-arabinose transferase-like glycosyltransferase
MVVSGLALAALALWLRLRLLGYADMGGDQSLTLDRALAWVHGGPWPLASIKSSLGIYNFPLVEYLWGLPLLFKPDILGVLWLIALVNLAGIGVAAWATGRVFGWRTAWWAALLFTVNPWAAYYGRLIWMQTLVPGFASLFYACVLLYFADQPKAVYVIVGALSLSAAIQFHPTALVLAAVVAIVGVCFYRRLRVKPLLVGAGLFLLSFAPYLIFELQHNLIDWHTLRSSLGQTAQTDLAPLTLMLELLQSKRIYDTLGSASALWRSQDLTWPVDALIAGWLGLAAGVSALTLAVQAWRHRARRAPWQPQQVGQFILLLWLGLPILFFLKRSYPLQNYYLLYLYPVPFVLLAYLADQLFTQLLRPNRPWSRVFGSRLARGLAGLAFLPLALISFQQMRLDLIGQNLLAAGASGHQRILDTQRAVETARRLLNARPECKLVIISEGSEYGLSRFALMREFTQSAYNTNPDRVRFVEAGVGYLVPAPCAYYFSVTSNAEAQVWLAANTRPLPEYTQHTPEETWTFYELSAAQRADQFGPFINAPALAEWANGVQLKHYQRESAPGAAPLTLTAWWAVTRAVPSRHIHFGVYLLTADNRQLIAQADGAGVDSTQWQAGDLFQTAVSLTPPADLQPGRYNLAEALYFFPEIERIPLAQPTGDLLTLETLSPTDATP